MKIQSNMYINNPNMTSRNIEKKENGSHALVQEDDIQISDSARKLVETARNKVSDFHTMHFSSIDGEIREIPAEYKCENLFKLDLKATSILGEQSAFEGCVNIGLPEIEMYEDVSTQNAYHTMRHLGFTHNMVMKVAKYASRDNARTPVQWSAEKNAGFTTADKPWFYINDNYKEINVEAAEKDENSILNYYRKLLKLRKENPIIIYGDFKMYNKLSRKLFVYERSYEGQRMLVINSFSEKPVKFKAPADFDITKSELLISNYDCKDKSNAFTLRPYESRAYLIK